jgi:lipopolysaccharide export system permease protein
MTDLFLTLQDGYVLEVRERERPLLQRVYFGTQMMLVRDVGTQLVRTRSDEYRSDREMSLGMLRTEIDSVRRELAGVRRDIRKQGDAALQAALDGPAAASGADIDIPVTPGLRGRFGAAPGGNPDAQVNRAATELRALANRAQHLRNRINQYQVEYHKKFAIPVACIIFVLIGAPLAVRFPRGGAGMVIVISLSIFGIYYMSLIGGETLGDDGKIAPFIGPWAPNIIFGLLALFALTRIGRETGTTRGGDWDDLWRTALAMLAKPFRRRRPLPVGEAAD